MVLQTLADREVLADLDSEQRQLGVCPMKCVWWG